MNTLGLDDLFDFAEYKKGTKAAENFVKNLEGLSVASRRLAIAVACGMPWRSDWHKLPKCYRREVNKAQYEAVTEQRWLAGGGWTPEGGLQPSLEPAITVADRRSPPFSKSFLLRLSKLPPSERRMRLVLKMIFPWWNNLPEAPQWLKQEWNYALGDWEDERQALGRPKPRRKSKQGAAYH